MRAGVRVLRSAPVFAVAEAAAATGSTETKLLDVLRRFGGRSRCSRLSVDAALPTKAMRQHGGAGLRSRVVSHRVCPPSVARAVGSDQLVTVRDAARGTAGWAGRPADRGVVPQRAAIFVWHDHQIDGNRQRTVVAAVAGSARCPSAMLQRLSSEPDVKLRIAVVSNQDCPTEVFERLSADPDLWVRCEVAGNVKCPPLVLERLSLLDRLSHGHGDNEWSDIRSNVAANPSTSAPVLERLSHSHNVKVSAAVARNPSTSAPVLERLSHSHNVKVSAAVASNPSTSAPVLERLSHSYHAQIRAWVASNPLCSPALLERLSSDSHDSVRRAVSAHSGCPRGVEVAGVVVECVQGVCASVGIGGDGTPDPVAGSTVRASLIPSRRHPRRQTARAGTHRLYRRSGRYLIRCWVLSCPERPVGTVWMLAGG